MIFPNKDNIVLKIYVSARCYRHHLEYKNFV